MKMTIKKSEIWIRCDACEKLIQDYGTIRLGTWDPMRRYSSGRKIQMNWKWRLCPKHYKQAYNAVKKSIEKI